MTDHQPKDYSADVGAAQQNREWRARIAELMDFSEINERLEKATIGIERAEALLGKADQS